MDNVFEQQSVVVEDEEQTIEDVGVLLNDHVVDVLYRPHVGVGVEDVLDIVLDPDITLRLSDIG